MSINLIGARIQHVCTLRGTTLAEVARQVGISKQQLYNVTAGRSDLSLHTAVEVAKALGCSLDYLVGLDTVVSRK